MYRFIRAVLFLFAPESAHSIALKGFKFACWLPGVNLLIRWYVGRCFVKDISLFGLRFKNPIGLAAGFDKNGHYIKEMSQLGFGFIEIGSVTALPALGNAQPRLFRIKNDQAIINRMGLNNLGVDALVKQLSGLNTGVPPLSM